MGFISAGARASILSDLETQPEPELPFGEGIHAVIEDIRQTGRTDSMSFQVQDAATKSLRRAKDLGLNPPDFPSWTWSNRLSESALNWLDANGDAIAGLRSGEDGPDDPFLKKGSEIRSEAAQRAQEARAKASRAGIGAQLVGGLAGQITDPFNLALLPLGAGAAEGLLMRMGVEAAIGAVSQAGVEAASLPAKESAGLAPTAGETAANIALTGAGAGGLTAVFHGAGLVARRLGMLADYRAKVADGRIVPTRESEEAAKALDDMIATVPPGGSPAEEAAHLRTTVAATEVLSADHPILEESARRRFDVASAAYENERNRAATWGDLSDAIGRRAAITGADGEVRPIRDTQGIEYTWTKDPETGDRLLQEKLPAGEWETFERIPDQDGTGIVDPEELADIQRQLETRAEQRLADSGTARAWDAGIAEGELVEGAARSQPEPPHVQLYRQVQDLTPEQLDAAVDNARLADRRLLAEVFGSEAEGKRYENLVRQQDSMDPNARDRAVAEVQRMEDALSDEQQNRLWGMVNDPEMINPEEVQIYRNAAYDIAGTSDRELVAEVGREATRLPDADVPVSRWDDRQRVAAFKFRRGMLEAEKRGLDMATFQEQALKAGAARFSDPADAEFMLQRFMKGVGPDDAPRRPAARLFDPQDIAAAEERAAATAADPPAAAGSADADTASGVWRTETEDLDAFSRATESNPDAKTNWIGEDGEVHTGRASDEMAKAAEEHKTLREILDCILTPSVKE